MLARFLDSLVESKNVSILLLPFLDPRSLFPAGSVFAGDREVLIRMAGFMKHRDCTTLYQGSLRPPDMIRVLAGLQGLVAIRLHAAILGLKAGLQPLAIEYASKTRRVLTRLGFGNRVVRFDELNTPATVDRVIADPVDPAVIAGLAAEVRSTFARVAGSVGGGRRSFSVIRGSLTFLALVLHAGIALYAAMPPLRAARGLRRTATSSETRYSAANRRLGWNPRE
jgi:hypothetical protein